MPVPNYQIYSTTTEQVPFTVSASGTVNPTLGTVQMAFLQVAPPTQPALSAYVGGTWQGGLSPFVALCLISGTASLGGGVATLSAGLWHAWIRLSDSPEFPVKYAGILQMS